ncbi:phosphate acetyltransferase [Lactobacillus kalixensis]|nr:phosphate acetyltransferase [Lactobacillus kalixensis]
MKVFDVLKKTAMKEKKTIVFPEGEDKRILEAATRLENEGVVSAILLGNIDNIKTLAEKMDLDISKVKLIDPKAYPDFERLAEDLYKIRKDKNTFEQVKEMLCQETFFGTMLVYEKIADGMVSGAAHSTADTVRPALQIVKTAKGMHRVSSSFIMERGDEKYIFADCAINIDPDAETLTEIAYQSAQTAKAVGIDPKIAFLSFSTKGSAKGEMIDKVVEATKLFNKKYPEIPADGELQFDAAFVPSIGEAKAPGSKVAGHANVFIFPELQSGNIGYKIAQRLGNFSAVGPILQGLAEPINDLSRGCSTQDVYDLAIVTAAQATRDDK